MLKLMHKDIKQLDRDTDTGCIQKVQVSVVNTVKCDVGNAG